MDTNLTINAEGLALNFATGNVPDWVQLLPAGKTIRGADGRVWTMEDAPAVVETFQRRGQRLPIDIEHATQIKGSKGEAAPAQGWITELDVRADGLWGKVDWTEAGQALLTSRSYGYLSPVFTYGARTGAVTRMVSAGLTNNPNLDLVALNHAGQSQETVMDKIVLETLGLNSDATAADAVVAIEKLKTAEAVARNQAETPDPTKFVPKADYELAMNRVAGFEEAEKKRRGDEIEAVVGGAIEAGKIAPASKAYHMAACRAEGGLDAFKAMVDAAPQIGGETGLTGKEALAQNRAELDAEELAICRQMGLTPEEFAKSKLEDEDD